MEYLLLPETVRIGYQDYRIVEWEHDDAVDAHRFGEADHKRTTIRIDTSYGPIQAANTLLHEILHVIHYLGDLSEEKEEERIVSVTANMLTQVWRDNPDLIRWFDLAISGKLITGAKIAESGITTAKILNSQVSCP